MATKKTETEKTLIELTRGLKCGYLGTLEVVGSRFAKVPKDKFRYWTLNDLFELWRRYDFDPTTEPKVAALEKFLRENCAVQIWFHNLPATGGGTAPNVEANIMLLHKEGFTEIRVRFRN